MSVDTSIWFEYLDMPDSGRGVVSLWMTPRGKRRCGVTQITIGIVMPLSRAMDWHGLRLCGEFAW